MISRLQKVFGCDLRSLALFRVAIACLIIWDVCDRFPHAEAFYSDAGFFDTEYAKAESPLSYSLNYLSGSVEYQQGLFIALGAAAVFLGAGLFTRLFTLVCWVLLISVHVRNPFVLIGGDTLLRMLLFWALFIPLGRVWSIDAWIRNQRKAKNGPNDLSPQAQTGMLLATAGTACLIIQVCIMYWCAGVAKMTDPWLNGTAMEYVFRLSLYVTPLGEWLLTQPFLLQTMNWGTLVVELFVPFLLFIPFWTNRFRLLTIAIFWGLHIGIDLTLDVGNFGIVSMVAWLPLLPGCVWNCCNCCGSKTANQQATRQVHSLPGGNDWHSGGNLWRNPWLTVLKSIVPLFFLVYIAAWNYAGLYVLYGTRWQLDFPASLQKIGWATMVAQNFQMFGDPPHYDPTYVFSGRQLSGEEVDLIRKHPASHSRPDQEMNLEITEQWLKLHRFLLRNPGNQKFHQALLDYFTKKWNASHDESDRVIESRLECYYEEIGPGFEAGSFVRRPDLANWKSADASSQDAKEKSDEELINELDSFLKGLDRGPISVGGK